MRLTLNQLYSKLPIVGQNVLCTLDGWRRQKQRFGGTFAAHLDALEDSAFRPIEWHYEQQWKSLVRVLDHARTHVDYYRFLPPVSEASDPRESILKTLASVQPLEKSVYRARTDDFLDPGARRHSYSLRYTSGTTGTALKIFDGYDRFAENYAVVWRQRRSFGVALGDPFLAFTGQLVTPLDQQGAPFWRRDYYSKRTLFSIYHMSDENLRSYIDPIHESAATYAEGYPSALHLASRAMLDAGRCLPPGKLKAVFTSSESLLANQREAIEEAFGAPVRDHYASSEHVVAMTACSENNLHVDMEFGIVEVEPVEETEDWVRGPLLVTGLGRSPAPMIRYRIGDVGTRSKRPCPCGRPGEVFLDVDGRIEDYIVTTSGRRVGRMDHVFKGRLDVVEAQILQHEPESILIKLVPGGDFTDSSRHQLVREVRARLGSEMGVEIELVDRIERGPNGKFRAVQSSIEGEA